MAFDWKPDIIVGIDFGMTCTGVAYSMGPEWPEPKTMQHWPGRLGHELRNKVDTALSYDISSGNLKRWGFLCDPDEESLEHVELFKLYLDPQYQDDTGIAPSIEQAQTWFRDYMKCLHSFINETFNNTIPRYKAKRVEYVFSVPTTWKNPALIAAMERLIKDAGFGQLAKEKSSIYLTEAEAAAVYATQRMEREEVFLVCDAGGGTTDLNVLKVASTATAQMELVPLSWTEGIAVGSTLIDYKARRALIDRLQPVAEHIPGDLEAVISTLVDEQFGTFKCSYGVEGLNVPKLFMQIPGLPNDTNFPEAGIENGKLVMTTKELKAIFDEQVNKMFGLIDQQLQIVMNSHPRERISYLIMSGGLSSSPYVQNCAKARYENGGNLRLANTNQLKVLTAVEPQLAVVHGLVIARTQKFKGGTEIFTKKCCPVSYGLQCRVLYNPEQHAGEPTVYDEFQKVTYAVQQIVWIIRQGEVVEAEEGISHHFRHKLALNKVREAQYTTIYMSTLTSHQLPSSIKKGGATKVCQIEFGLDPPDMKLKNRHWYQFAPKYYRAEYQVRALIGAGLKFQVWGKNGMKSKDHEDIQVDWTQISGEDAPLGLRFGNAGAGGYRGGTGRFWESSASGDNSDTYRQYR